MVVGEGESRVRILFFTCKMGVDGAGQTMMTTGKEEAAEQGMAMMVLYAIGRWFKKYFLEGQRLSEEMERKLSRVEDTKDMTFFQRHRRLIAFTLPAVFFHIIWWSYMGAQDLFHLFTERSGGKDIPRYYMSITMLFGSMIAGATSEGGASVAFPVMTLVFDILPKVARDFSFMIQSVGMTSAAFTILVMRVKIEMHALIFCTLGGMFGIVIGLEWVAPELEPPYSKMYFVVIWFAFAFSLYWLNRNYGRRVFEEVPDCFETWHGIPWKPLVLLAFGFLGGIFSAIAGSGIDICSFSALTLLFRVSEKIATPTSVILMAINTCLGFFWREVVMGGVENDSWGFFAVCIPIVVVGAPLGSLVGSHFHRLVLASFVYVTDTAQLVLALIVVKPWVHKDDGGKTDTPTHLTITSAAILISGAIFFKLIEMSGRRLLDIQEARIAERERETKLSIALSIDDSAAHMLKNPTSSQKEMELGKR